MLNLEGRSVYRSGTTNTSKYLAIEWSEIERLAAKQDVSQI